MFKVLGQTRAWLLALLLVAAPLAGGIYKWAWAILCLLSIVCGALTLWSTALRSSTGTKPDSVFLILICFVGLLVIQLLPLPLGLVGWLSPIRLDHQAYLASVGPDRNSWISITAAMGTTRDAVWLAIACVAVLYTGRNLGREPGQIPRWFGLLGAIASALAVFGVGLWLFQGQRLYASFAQPNRAAAYFAMCAPLLIALHMTRKPHNGKPRKVTVLLLVAAAVVQLALLMTLSRWGIASLIAASLLVMGLFVRRKRTIFRASAVVLALVTLICVFLVLAPLWERYSLLMRGDVTLSGRFKCWTQSLGIVRDFPFLGSGAGSFRYVFAGYQQPDLPGWWKFTHSDYLNLLCDTGIIGAVLIGCFLVLVFRKVYPLRTCENSEKRWLAGAALTSFLSILIHGIADFNFQIPANAITAAFILGLLLGMADEQHSRAPSAPTKERPPRWRLVVAGITSLGVIVALWPLGRITTSGLLLLREGEQNRLSYLQRAEKTSRTMAGWAQRARQLDAAYRLDPWDAEVAFLCTQAYVVAGQVHEGEKRATLWTRAREIVQESLRNCPLDGRMYYLRGLLASAAGERGRAKSAFLTATKVNRAHSTLNFEAGMRLLSVSKADEGVSAEDRAIAEAIFNRVIQSQPGKMHDVLEALDAAGDSAENLKRFALAVPHGLASLAQYYLERKNWPLAAALLTEALEQGEGKHNHRVYLWACKALLRKGQFSRAETVAIEYITISPPSQRSSAANQVLHEYAQLKLHRAAYMTLLTAHKTLGNDEIDVLPALARAAPRVGKRKEAIEYLKLFVNTRPGCGALEQLGWHTRHLGHFNVALAYFERSLEYCPQAYGPNWGKALVLSAQKRDDEAMKLLANLTASHPKRAQPYWWLAKLQRRNSLLQDARATLESGIQNIPAEADKFKKAIEDLP